MTSKTSDSENLAETLMTSEDDSCRTGSCSTNSCSPCRLIWTVMAVYLVVLLIMETVL